ncbi:FAD-binding oxidoreductase [Janibacter sp. YIM B02568]|uniref:FAD-binding oxidoreductase n=1 Tax=Janibacter endophyticus TaxID=2806261 RepID=UPI001951C76E|nr:FAD-binding oxidoreductase [Janibacter endophyticus]MBM6545107.1 FAD-binding oxidoreductase [Janibacter endophyticus]
MAARDDEDGMLLADLRATLGDIGVLTDRADVAAYLTDWTGTRHGVALAVLRPASTGEVAEAVRLCAAAGVAVTPQGGNTGLVGGGIAGPERRSVVLSLSRMRQVRSIDPVGDTIVVDAGVVLADIHDAADRAGRLFPVSLGSEGSCTVGGLVSTNAGGTAVLRYGMTRDLVLGLEVVLPDGRVWDGLRTLRKDNTGYDLKQLFIGAEGTLGVVTGVALRLVPATPRRATALVGLAGIGEAVALLPVLREHAGDQLTAFEVINAEALDLVVSNVPGARHPFGPRPWYALVEVAGTTDEVEVRLEEALSAALDVGLLDDDIVVAGTGAQRAALWALREGISEAQQAPGLSIKHDVTLPATALSDFVELTGRRLGERLPGVRLITYGHVGDGNLHYNLSPARGEGEALRACAAELTEIVYDEVRRRSGSISAEHGVGTAKRDAVAVSKSAEEIGLMRAVKDAIDPAGLMNPGKVVP